MFQYFYHASLRKLVVAFGSLFDEIYIAHVDKNGVEKKRIKVPISYAAKEKFYRRVVEIDKNTDRNSFESLLPRIGFEMTSLAYDSSRKTNSLNKSISVRTEAGTTMSYSYNEVPYNVDFSVNIMTRNIDDGHQILEQIVPYFTPDFTISMNFTDLDRKIDVPIVLSSVEMSEDSEGDMNDRRLVTYSLAFQAKSYIFGPIKSSKLVKDIKLSFFDLDGYK